MTELPAGAKNRRMHNLSQARVVALAAAIAHAEGFWVPNARPRRNNNPGDLVADGSINGVFSTRLEGFDTLAAKVARILEGESTTYPTSISWPSFAYVWTGGDHAGTWCDAVCDDLNVDPSTTLQQWLQAEPAPAPAPQTQSA